MKKAKVFTVVNYVLSAILWLLGVLTLAFNLLGLWTPWQLAGFGFMFCIPIVVISQGIAIICCGSAEKKYLRGNLIAFGVSAGFVLLTLLISTKWFW